MVTLSSNTNIRVGETYKKKTSNTDKILYKVISVTTIGNEKFIYTFNQSSNRYDKFSFISFVTDFVKVK